VGICFQVVDEPQVLQPERFFDVLISDDPWEIGHHHTPLLHGAGDAEAGVIGFQFALSQKFLGDFFEARIITTGKGSEIVRREAKAFTKECEVHFCAANIACKNHEVRMARDFFRGKGIALRDEWIGG